MCRDLHVSGRDLYVGHNRNYYYNNVFDRGEFTIEEIEAFSMAKK